jgi:hypothetical protein
MAIWWEDCFTKILNHNSCKFTRIQSNISVHGLYAKSYKFISTSHWLSSCSSRRYSTKTSCDCVSYFSYQSISKFPIIVNSSCVISTLCALNLEYQFVNPTTQVALFSVCTGGCPSINSITWIVYSGVMNSSSNIVQWTPFSLMNQYQNIWFFGSSVLSFIDRFNHIYYFRFEYG